MGMQGSGHGSNSLGSTVWLQMVFSPPHHFRSNQEVSPHSGNHLEDLQFSPGSSAPESSTVALEESGQERPLAPCPGITLRAGTVKEWG